MTEIVHTVIPYATNHVPLGMIEHAGRQWIVREIDPDAGWTVIEHAVPDAEASLTRDYITETYQLASERAAGEIRTRRTFDAVGVAAAAVFLFLALMVGTIDHLTFADVVGCIIAFLFLVWWFTRPKRARPVRGDDGEWYYPV